MKEEKLLLFDSMYGGDVPTWIKITIFEFKID
jgi:hypothetical protein